MAPALSLLLTQLLSTISNPPTTTDFTALSLLLGSNLLLAALDLVDHGEVGRLSLPNGTRVIQVSGSSGAYTVYPDVGGAAGARGYCPCPYFTHEVMHRKGNVVCKHLLAVMLCERLDSFVDKEVGLVWLAGLSTKFATPP